MRQKNRRKKARLFNKQGGRCYYCQRQMIRQHNHQPGVPVPKELATLEHLDDRWSPERGRHPRTIRVVLACWECNHRRGKESEANQPREELWRRSGSYPLSIALAE